MPIVEEGRDFDDPITLLAIRDYLTAIRELKPDVVLLGCTHYPVLMPALQEFLGTGVELIDSGDAVARQARNLLSDLGLLSSSDRPGTVQCYVSDFPQRFAAIGACFLGEPLPHVARASVESWRLFQSSANRAASA